MIVVAEPVAAQDQEWLLGVARAGYYPVREQTAPSQVKRDLPRCDFGYAGAPNRN